MAKIKNIVYITILVIAIVTIVATAIQRHQHYIPDDWVAVRISENENLWTIANKYGNEYDTRRIIDMIEDKNNIDACIDVGDIIYIPVFN